MRRPMLATAGPQPPGPGWTHEVKWDGMRVLIDVQEGKTRLFSRAGRDVTVAFPELLAVGENTADALLDAEVIALSDGTPSFAALAARMHVGDQRRARELADAVPVSAMAFDVLRLYGVDLVDRPLSERRATLDKLQLPGQSWSRSPLYDDGSALLNATLQQGLEGVVSKRLTSTYQPGRRSPDWIKVAHRRHQACVVGGWRPETGSSDRLGALLLGVVDPDGALRFCGRVGSGIDRRVGQQLLAELRRLARPSSPFADALPAPDAAGARHVEPELLVEVRHIGWTSGHRLRQPVFRGLRSDLNIEDATIEDESVVDRARPGRPRD